MILSFNILVIEDYQKKEHLIIDLFVCWKNGNIVA